MLDGLTAAETAVKADLGTVGAFIAAVVIAGLAISLVIAKLRGR